MIQLHEMENESYKERDPLNMPNYQSGEELIKRLINKYGDNRKKWRASIEGALSDSWIEWSPGDDTSYLSEVRGLRMIKWRYFWHKLLEAFGFWKVLVIITILISLFPAKNSVFNTIIINIQEYRTNVTILELRARVNNILN